MSTQERVKLVQTANQLWAAEAAFEGRKAKLLAPTTAQQASLNSPPDTARPTQHAATLLAQAPTQGSSEAEGCLLSACPDTRDAEVGGAGEQG